MRVHKTNNDKIYVGSCGSRFVQIIQLCCPGQSIYKQNNVYVLKDHVNMACTCRFSKTRWPPLFFVNHVTWLNFLSCYQQPEVLTSSSYRGCRKIYIPENTCYRAQNSRKFEYICFRSRFFYMSSLSENRMLKSSGIPNNTITRVIKLSKMRNPKEFFI